MPKPPPAAGGLGPPRVRCRYGVECYQKGAAHRARFAHPVDPDWAAAGAADVLRLAAETDDAEWDALAGGGLPAEAARRAVGRALTAARGDAAVLTEPAFGRLAALLAKGVGVAHAAGDSASAVVFMNMLNTYSSAAAAGPAAGAMAALPAVRAGPRRRGHRVVAR
jgi:hypothetical protein